MVKAIIYLNRCNIITNTKDNLLAEINLKNNYPPKLKNLKLFLKTI